jgi:superfamily II DNA/RNA helicase
VITLILLMNYWLKCRNNLLNTRLSTLPMVATFSSSSDNDDCTSRERNYRQSDDGRANRQGWHEKENYRSPSLRQGFDRGGFMSEGHSVGSSSANQWRNSNTRFGGSNRYGYQQSKESRTVNSIQRKIREFKKENHVDIALLTELGIKYRSIINGEQDGDNKKSEELFPLNSLGISEVLQQIVAENLNISSFFPIQALTFQELKGGRDVIARSRTGTGKTLAFAIPAIEMLLKLKAAGAENVTSRSSESKPNTIAPKVLVMTPTRELCLQVKEEFVKLGRPLRFKTVAVYGGASVSTQREELLDAKYHRQVVDIVVGTPGRLQHFVEERTLDLGQIQFLILDEADRMLDEGFSEDMHKILRIMSQQRAKDLGSWTTCLFSATMPESMLRFACNDILKQPSSIFLDTVGNSPIRVAQGIQQFCVPHEHSGYRSVTQAVTLSAIEQAVEKFMAAKKADPSSSDSDHPFKMIVFVEKKSDADYYARMLASSEKLCAYVPDYTGHRLVKSFDKFPVGALHGDISQKMREARLDRFRATSPIKGIIPISCLVCTDVAARGLDIPNVDLVIQVEPPSTPETYIHRVGRTGRAGKPGFSVIFFNMQDHRHQMAVIQEIIGSKLKAFPKHTQSANSQTTHAS